MGERTIPLTNSLVQYDNPILVTSHEDAHRHPKSAAASAAVSQRPGTSTAEQKRETEEILNAILPPKEWEENGNLWLQQVSKRVHFVNR